MPPSVKASSTPWESVAIKQNVHNRTRPAPVLPRNHHASPALTKTANAFDCVRRLGKRRTSMVVAGEHRCRPCPVVDVLFYCNTFPWSARCLDGWRHGGGISVATGREQVLFPGSPDPCVINVPPRPLGAS